MSKQKVRLADNIARVIFIESDATIGATFGTDFRLPSGDVATVASFKALLGVTDLAANQILDHRLLRGLTLGDDHPQYTRKDTLTTRGDMYYRGVSTIQRLALGSDRQILRSTATDPAWETISPTVTLGSDLSGNVTLANLASGTLDATIVNDAVSDIKLRNSAGLSVIGRSANTLGDPADIVGTDGGVLRVAGTSLGFGSILSTSVSDFVEAAQDAVGLAFTDSARIDFTYSDVTNTFTADIVLASIGTTYITDDAVTNAKLRNSAGLSVVGRSANTIGDPADIVGTDGQVLRVSGTALGFGTIATAGLADASVTNAKLANMAQSTIKGRAEGAGTGAPTDLTPTEVAAVIDGEAISWAARQTYTFAGSTANPTILLSSSQPMLTMDETDQLSGERRWLFGLVSKTFQFRSTADDGTGSIIWGTITRGTGAAITNIALGDTTNNNTYTFGSSGLATFTGGITCGALTSSAVTAGRFIPNSSTVPAAGVYLPAANDVGIATNTTLRWDVSTTAITSTLPLRGPDGTAAAPAYSFSSDSGNGMYLAGTDTVGVAANGAQVMSVTTDATTIMGLSETPTILVGTLTGTALSPAVGFTFAATGINNLRMVSRAEASAITTYRVNGATGSPSPVLLNDGLFSFFTSGAYTSTPDYHSGGGFYLAAAENWSATNRGLRMSLFSTPVGSTTLTLTLGLIGDQVSFRDGTAAAPAVTFQNDADCGMYRIGTNNIGLSAGGTLRLGISATAITAALPVSVTGNLTLAAVGNGVAIKEGTNAAMGVATLVLGTVVVTNTRVTANSRIQLTAQTLGTVTVPQALAISARTAGTSFTILSSNLTDTSVVAWQITEPAP